MDDQKISRKSLEEVVGALASEIDAWNRAAADDDRGPANDAICLTVFDDGSGRIGKRCTFDVIENYFDFDNLDQLCDLMKSFGFKVTD